jgi:hypothetical protein
MKPESFDKAVDALRDTTRKFDKKNGTWISKYLDRALPEAKPPSPSRGVSGGSDDGCEAVGESMAMVFFEDL